MTNTLNPDTMEPYRSCVRHREPAKFSELYRVQDHQVSAGVAWLSSQAGKHQHAVLLLCPTRPRYKLRLSGATLGVLPAGRYSLPLHIQLLNRAH